MQGVDLLFLIVILFLAWSGWRSGFIVAAIGLAAAVIALLFMALPLSEKLTDQLRRSQLADRLTLPAE
jgi:uncharacterized membrane protein required for colicin V production